MLAICRVDCRRSLRQLITLPAIDYVSGHMRVSMLCPSPRAILPLDRDNKLTYIKIEKRTSYREKHYLTTVVKLPLYWVVSRRCFTEFERRLSPKLTLTNDPRVS